MLTFSAAITATHQETSLCRRRYHHYIVIIVVMILVIICGSSSSVAVKRMKFGFEAGAGGR
jgi:hypothetical protein